MYGHKHPELRLLPEVVFQLELLRGLLWQPFRILPFLSFPLLLVVFSPFPPFSVWHRYFIGN